ncbi:MULTISPECIES: GNAT family N-acetyltransferase [unclassified Streptomyces]|uniref:GNAT family N-acetyltransferase n=1 Tax=unclassified Streptomyces TaxID=2593676 RepID=UPI002E77FC49|nr:MULTISPECIES: GNAT family N-acetyltransferase [unclassified Streptomyces]MEE1759932.1 GNAT family N-acetyltransferase [Streptomyces sp. SP18BB07]MEE1833267.1 GNAT family N-acetyltransferase [Streptomyces sp. SP17KL33]
MTTGPVRLQLDVADFDLARFQPYVDKCRTSGIRLTTLSELGDTPEHRRALYDLNKECSADIPERGAFFTYDEYHRLRFEVPSYDPRGVVLALDGDRWIGMAATSDRRGSGFVFNEMTGVRAGHRGRGISVAMKTFGIGFAGICGVSTVRTVHHPANSRAIAMNRTLGYVDGDW